MEKKFERDNEVFLDYMNWLERIDVDTRTITSQFPAYVGSVNLARFISIYEAYKEVLSLSGDIADLGTYQGGSFFHLWEVGQNFRTLLEYKGIRL